MSYLSSSKPITDIKIIANKTELPGGYQLLEHAADGQKVQLWEGRNLISLTKRFLCYSRQNFDIGLVDNGNSDYVTIDENPPMEKQVVITDIKIQSNTLPMVEGYTYVDQTLDDGQTALKKHHLLIKYSKRIIVKQAITQIILVDSSQLGSVPPKFSILPSINGFSLCFMLSPIHNSSSSGSSQKDSFKSVEQQLKDLELTSNSATQPMQPATTTNNSSEEASPIDIIEKLPFKSSDVLGFKGLDEFSAILQNQRKIITESEIYAKFDYDFVKERKVLESN